MRFPLLKTLRTEIKAPGYRKIKGIFGEEYNILNSRNNAISVKLQHTTGYVFKLSHTGISTQI